MKKNHFKNAEKAQGFVELVLILPLLLILIAGIVDLGRLFNSYIVLRDAAQEGANYGSLVPSDLAGIETRVRQSSNAPLDLTDTTKIHVLTTTTDAYPCVNKFITVKVTQDFEVSTPLIGSVIGQSFPISADVTNTIMSPPCS